MKLLKKKQILLCLLISIIFLSLLAGSIPSILLIKTNQKEEINSSDYNHSESFICRMNSIDYEPNYILQGEVEVFFDNFESGISNWESITGLWHLTDNSSSWPDPYYSPIHSVWFGDESTGTFNTGSRARGNLTSIPIDLSDCVDATLEFYHWREGEGGGLFDMSFVYISVDGINWVKLYQNWDSYIAPWEKKEFDISAYIGNVIQLRFYFDTVDSSDNNYRGWLIDDVLIYTSALNDHDLKVMMEAPTFCEIGIPYQIKSTVTNNGNYDENGVNLLLYLDDVIVNSTTIACLTVGANETITYEWIPPDYGTYNFTAYAIPVLGEILIGDNIATEILYTRNVTVILFDESHNPAYSIGSNPAFDTPGGYSEFAGLLAALDYVIDTINPGTYVDVSELRRGDILVIVASQRAYNVAEINAIETWVRDGGSLLLISDHTIFGSDMDPLAARFGFNFANDILTDSDDNLGTGDSSQLFYDGPNILSHPITVGVSRVEMYAGDGLIAVPIDGISIIKTDTDGTGYWDDINPALGVPVMGVLDDGSAGAGKVCAIGDTNLWDNAWDLDNDGDLDFYDSDNEFLAMNTIYWLTSFPSGTIIVTCPNNASSWLTGTNHSITWFSTDNKTDVKIELFKDGVFLLEIAASTPNDGEFSWTIPLGLNGSTQYQIKISNVTNPVIEDFSDYFEIFNPSITVTNPDSMSSWRTGCSNLIIWTSRGNITNVKIELFKDDVFVLEIVASTFNDGAFTWSVPSTLDDSTQYQIKITDVTNPATEDFSDYFEIFNPSITVTNPDSMSVWEMGTSYDITWTSTETITFVKIELFKNGVFVLEIIGSTNNDGVFSWTLPTDLVDDTNYQIRISETSAPAIFDDSPLFAITRPDVPGGGGIPGYSIFFVLLAVLSISMILLKKSKTIRTLK